MVGRQTCNLYVVGSNPTHRTAECNPGQVVYTHLPLVIKQYNLVSANGW